MAAQATDYRDMHDERADIPALEVDRLTVRYGSKTAVDGLSFRVPAGSICGFLGPNGAGKTTTIKTLLGFRKPDGGFARVLGYDMVRDSMEIRARVGYVSETAGMYDYLTIPQMCDFCRGISRRWNQSIVDRYIGAFGLPTRGKIKQLSKGMKSQLALSLALGSEPEMLILDEPTTGLDPLARHQFLNTVVGDFAAVGKSIFFSSHILSEVEAVADWVCIIDGGRLVVCDELDNLKLTQKALKIAYDEAPSHEEIEALRALPHSVHVEQEGRNVRMVARGDVGALAAMLKVRSGVRDIEIVDLNLEDLFLEYMKEARRAG